ncbi:MAG: TetR/AcrR family transcriptional regulator [Lautropia sp.]|nr:TetR/AcrR family transcriptional regulator [Lautropia sp.]
MHQKTSSPSNCPKRTRSWERRKEQRPGELLEAAAKVFVARGYAAARLDDVATMAGVSKGTLYLYYAGKEELFKAVVRMMILPVIEQFRTKVEQATGCSADLLSDVLRCWWSCFNKPHVAGIIKLVISEASNFPEVARFFHEEVASTGHDVIRRIIRRGIERQEFRNAPNVDVAVHMAMSPLILKLIWAESVGQCIPASSRLDPPDFIRHHVNLVLMTLCASTEASARAAVYPGPADTAPAVARTNEPHADVPTTKPTCSTAIDRHDAFPSVLR